MRTKDGRGTVVEVNLLTGMLKVAPEKDSAAAKFYPKSEVRPIREGRGEGRQESRAEGRGSRTRRGRAGGAAGGKIGEF